ncbi:hypothetical protein CCP3SC1AL1_1170018 [Gammaproteobacteria bacterium]|jgi:hypothetical protein
MEGDCMGCGMSAQEVMKQHEITEEEMTEEAVFTDSGYWYCHTDCLRDSR